MDTYQRNGRLEQGGHEPSQANKAPVQPEEKGVYMDGYNQVLEMLQAADPAFRASLIKRLSARDPALASRLRSELSL